MFAVTVEFHIETDKLPVFLDQLQRNAADSLEREPGCTLFDVCTDGTRPGEVFLYEIYTDAAAFDTHLKSSHFKSFDAAVTDMVLSKKVKTFDKVARPYPGRTSRGSTAGV